MSLKAISASQVDLICEPWSSIKLRGRSWNSQLLSRHRVNTTVAQNLKQHSMKPKDLFYNSTFLNARDSINILISNLQLTQ